MRKTFVISDVHGCATELNELITKLPLDSESLLVFLGDFIDRGTEVPQVIETLLRLKERYETICLTGNHEDMMAAFFRDPRGEAAGMFIYNGGASTLAAYADDFGRVKIPESHREFFSRLRDSYETDEHFFVHAGVPEIPLAELNEGDYRSYLLWTREPFLTSNHNWGKTIVHGHTPVRSVEVYPNRVNIDTGCVLGNALSAVELSTGTVYSVPRRTDQAPLVLRDKSSKRSSVRFDGAVPVYVRCRDEIVEFITVNYSQFGMLIYEAADSGRALLSPGENVYGVVGSGENGRAEFEASVVRLIRRPRLAYALAITHWQEEP